MGWRGRTLTYGCAFRTEGRGVRGAVWCSDCGHARLPGSGGKIAVGVDATVVQNLADQPAVQKMVRNESGGRGSGNGSGADAAQILQTVVHVANNFSGWVADAGKLTLRVVAVEDTPSTAIQDVSDTVLCHVLEIVVEAEPVLLRSGNAGQPAVAVPLHGEDAAIAASISVHISRFRSRHKACGFQPRRCNG
jgi:hypothetical protein